MIRTGFWPRLRKQTDAPRLNFLTWGIRLSHLFLSGSCGRAAGQRVGNYGHDSSVFIEELGIDKSLISRWLDEDNPTTPGQKWAKKLGRYFAAGPEDDDFVDIFTDPDQIRFQKMTRGYLADLAEIILSFFCVLS